MSETKNTLDTTTTSSDESGSSLFYRMTHRTYEAADTDTNIPIANVDENHMTIVGDTYDMSTDVARRSSMSSDNYAFVYGNDLLAKMSELSMAIEYDEEYRGDYIRLYNLLSSLLRRLP